LHEWTSIKLMVTYCVDTRVFLTRYSVIQNIHIANQRCSMIVIKKFSNLRNQ